MRLLRVRVPMRPSASPLLLVVALLLWGSPALAQRSGAGALQVGLGVGPSIWLSSSAAGVRLSPGVFLALPLSSTAVQLEVGLALGLEFAGADNSSVTTIDVLPQLRMGGELQPRLRLFGEFGVGPVFRTINTRVLGNEVSSSGAGIGIAAGAGLGYALAPELELTLTPLRFQFESVTTRTVIFDAEVTSTSNTTRYSPMLGIAYRF